MYDSHMHTAFSADSEMTAEDALRKAEQLGIGMVFTEHLDIGLPGKSEFCFDPEEYWKSYEPLRGNRLFLGVEIGMSPGAREENRAFAGRVPFDMVVGSIHMLDGTDLYYPAIYESREKQELYRAYFVSMAREVYQNDFIDVLAHIDYIARYAIYEDPSLDYGVFGDEIDAMLGALVATDTLLELNTRRLSDPKVLEELKPIYSRYRELGGRYVTIGSDAHTPDAIGAHFSLARDFAESCSLRPVTFCERRMEICRM